MKNSTLLIILAVLLIPFVFLMAGLAKNNVPMTKHPGFIKRFFTYLFTHTAETKENNEFEELEIKTFNQSEERLFENIKNSIKKLGWEIENENSKEKKIHAIITLGLFKFKDDINIHVQKVDDNKSKLHIISVSRVGKGDLGANTRHILNLYEYLNN